jgi:hypothetical protein
MDDSFDHHRRQTQNHLLKVFRDKTHFQILWLCVFISSQGAGYKQLKISKIVSSSCPEFRGEGKWIVVIVHTQNKYSDKQTKRRGQRVS